MDPSKLAHFLVVADHKHFGRAAESLGLSQQGLSKSVAALERSLRVKLFERGQFGAVLTPYGEALWRRAKVVDAELRLGRAEIAALRGAREGSVRIGAGPSFVGRLMPMAMLRMHAANPGVQISTRVASTPVLYPMLLRGELEFVVSAPTANFVCDPELMQETLFTEFDCLVVRAEHPLASRHHVALEDLIPYTWIMPLETGIMWERMGREFTAAGLPSPARVLRADSTALSKELLLRNDCVMLMSRENTNPELTTGRLVELDVPRIREQRIAYLTMRARSNLQPAARELADYIRQVCAEIYGKPR
jgi:DNA-binding transcriptional LysR family regulator